MTLEKLRELWKTGQDITINFVGDSITCGLQYCRAEETYVAKFAAALAAVSPLHAVYRYDGIEQGALLPLQGFDGPILVSLGNGAGRLHVIKNGVSGNTVLRAYRRKGDFTGQLADGRSPEVTFLMFGINDALRSDPDKYVPAEVFEKNYRTLLQEIRQQNPETLLILMTPTYNDQSVDAHSEKVLALAREEDIPYIDLHTLWLEHYDADTPNFGQGDWLKSNGTDACHPTPKSAEIMGRYICDAFVDMLG